jgi:hypothetical protein
MIGIAKLYCGTGDPWAPDLAGYLTDEEIAGHASMTKVHEDAPPRGHCHG